jgi:membrane-bound serine protease (ClpP class)
MVIWFPVLLFAVGFIALFLELFVPAAGMIGAAGIICMVVGTVLGYRSFGTTVGTLFLIGTLIGTPAMIIIGLKLFPRTFVGKKLILKSTQTQESGFTSYTTERYEDLMNKEGEALTLLRPSGMVRIDGKKYSVVTSGELIERGKLVKVIKVEGSRVVVKAVPGNDKKGAAKSEKEGARREDDEV